MTPLTAKGSERVPSAGGAARLSSWSSIAAIVVKVPLVLALLDTVVRGPFYERYIYVPFVMSYPVLADRTGGGHIELLVDALARRRPTLRIAFVGDSTMKALGWPEDAHVPALIQGDLRGRFAGVDVEVVDASMVGLYASDGVLLVAKLMPHVDAVVYGLAMRAFAKARQASWIRSVGAEVDAGTIMRIAHAGGLRWLARPCRTTSSRPGSCRRVGRRMAIAWSSGELSSTSGRACCEG